MAPQTKLNPMTKCTLISTTSPLDGNLYPLTLIFRNVPIGVQFDTLVGIQSKHKDLPWCLTFHYKGYQEEQGLKLEGLNFLRFHYINSLKESQNLRTGSSNEILSMQKKDEQRMIEGLKRHNYENFWEINQSLCDRSIGEFKKYAIRVFSNRHHTYVQPNIDVHK